MPNEPPFTYGPLSLGIFRAILCIAPLVLTFSPQHTPHYVLFIIFLIFFLRPILEETGLYQWVEHKKHRAGISLWRKRTEKKRIEIETKEKQEKLRKRHVQSNDLPKNW